MPRQVRIQFPGAFYHVMARGDRHEAIYTSEDDYYLFLKTLAEVCTKTGWRVHAYALMGNHYHLVIETPQPNLVYGMSRLQTTYTVRFNARHRTRGHLFGDRYKAILVQHGEGDYFRTLIDYVHLNPVRAGLANPRKGIDTYPWTSLAYYKLTPSKRLPWQIASGGLSSAGHPDTASGRRKFLDSLGWRAKAEKAGLTEIEDQSLQSTLRRGWYFGTQAFRDKLLKLADATIARRRTDPNHFGPDVREHGERQARAIIKRGLQEFELTKPKLAKLPKND
ncbi:MAG: transposase, partial [Verrucomicrobiales bacterium]|nr:transposase [Verrucomicrobiales bacterium]